MNRRTSTAVYAAWACALALLPGCATTSYHNRSFTAIIPDTGSGSLPAGTTPVARFAGNFDAEVDQLYAQGDEVIGYAKFTSLLAPGFAERDARLAAQARGASLALMAQPSPGKLNQYSYMTLFWRPVPANGFLFGAYYSDLPPNALGAVGCQNNVVMLGPVVAGTPAADMGLAEGDAIIFVDDVRITDARSLDDALAARAGKQVQIRYLRKGQRLKSTGTLGSARQAKPRASGEPAVGVALIDGPVDPQLATEAGGDKGVFVDGVDYATPACEAGFRTGDLLLEVNGGKIKDSAEALAALNRVHGEAHVAVLRGGKPMDVLLATENLPPSRVRLGLREAAPLRPWQGAEGRSWTWLTVTGMALSNAAGVYAQEMANAQARAAEYNRRQAAAAANQGPRVTFNSRRGGGDTVTTRTGDVYHVDHRTATMLMNNPGYYVQSGRRGSIEVYNATGKRVTLPPEQRGLPITLESSDWMRNIKFGDSLNMVFSNQDINRGGISAGQDYSGSSINNPDWGNGVYYDTQDQRSWEDGTTAARGNHYDTQGGH